MNSSLYEYQTVLLILLFIAPVYYLIDTAFVIIRRNAKHIENRLAFITTGLLALMVFFQALQQLLPAAYTIDVTLYLVYPAALLSSGSSFLLHIIATRMHRVLPAKIWAAAALLPMLYYVTLLLLKGESYYSSEVQVEAGWKQGALSDGSYYLFAIIAVIALINLMISTFAMLKAKNRAERSRNTVLFKANLYYQASAVILLILYAALLNIVFIPTSAIYMTAVVWGAVLRIFMKHDFLPIERKYEMLYHLTPAAIVILDKNMVVKEANPGALKLFGLEREAELIDQPLSAFLPKQDHSSIRDEYFSLFPDQDWSNRELAIINRRLETKLVGVDTQIMEDGDEWRVLAVIRDITRQKEEEQAFHFMAHHDALTKLPNRYLFNAELESALADIEPKEGLLAVLLIDLDRFKLVNDTLGHSAGDEALIKVADRLQQCMDNMHLLARLGGDEFIVLIKYAQEYEDIIKMAEEVLASFQYPITLLGQDFFFGGSIGISVYPHDGNSTDALMKKADIAMYSAKRSGGNQYRLYTNEMITLVQRNVQMEKHLRKSLERKEWVLHYQPQFDMKSGKLVGAEALIRWQSEELGMVYPGDFITLAEQTGLINDIGRWVIQEACNQGKRWQDEGWEDFMIAVNVSSKQLDEPFFVKNVQSILQKSGLRPSHLCLEITESMVVNKLNAARSMLDELVAIGIHIAIDDFGTGYSSLSVLRQLPISIIKIDRSFITDMVRDRDGLSIVKTIVSMGHELNKHIVAEGVETEEQEEHLRQLGCDKAQGYYYHKPLPLVSMNELLKKSG